MALFHPHTVIIGRNFEWVWQKWSVSPRRGELTWAVYMLMWHDLFSMQCKRGGSCDRTLNLATSKIIWGSLCESNTSPVTTKEKGIESYGGFAVCRSSLRFTAESCFKRKSSKKNKTKKTVHHPLRTKQQSDTFRDELVVEQLAAEEAESILD